MGALRHDPADEGEGEAHEGQGQERAGRRSEEGRPGGRPPEGELQQGGGQHGGDRRRESEVGRGRHESTERAGPRGSAGAGGRAGATEGPEGRAATRRAEARAARGRRGRTHRRPRRRAAPRGEGRRRSGPPGSGTASGFAGGPGRRDSAARVLPRGRAAARPLSGATELAGAGLRRSKYSTSSSGSPSSHAVEVAEIGVLECCARRAAAVSAVARPSGRPSDPGMGEAARRVVVTLPARTSEAALGADLLLEPADDRRWAAPRPPWRREGNGWRGRGRPARSRGARGTGRGRAAPERSPRRACRASGRAAARLAASLIRPASAKNRSRAAFQAAGAARRARPRPSGSSVPLASRPTSRVRPASSDEGGGGAAEEPVRRGETASSRHGTPSGSSAAGSHSMRTETGAERTFWAPHLGAAAYGVATAFPSGPGDGSRHPVRTVLKPVQHPVDDDPRHRHVRPERAG